jgi:hypothetical protein
LSAQLTESVSASETPAPVVTFSAAPSSRSGGLRCLTPFLASGLTLLLLLLPDAQHVVGSNYYPHVLTALMIFSVDLPALYVLSKPLRPAIRHHGRSSPPPSGRWRCGISSRSSSTGCLRFMCRRPTK